MSGKATYEELEEENCRLHVEMAMHFCDVRKVMAWWLDDDRKRPENAFTAGPERQVAYMIERGIPRAARTKPATP